MCYHEPEDTPARRITTFLLIAAAILALCVIFRGTFARAQSMADLQATRVALVAQVEQAKTEQAATAARLATLQSQLAAVDKQIAAATPAKVPVPTNLVMSGDASGVYVSGRIIAGSSHVRVAITSDAFKTSIDKTYTVSPLATEFRVGPFDAVAGKPYVAWARVVMGGTQSGWSPTTPPYTVPGVIAPDRPATQPATRGVHLTISDDSIPDAAIRDVGFDGLRIWATYGAGGVIPRGPIDRANKLVANGLHATLVVTPTVGASSFIDPTPTIDHLIASCDRRVRINLVNEANWGGYWPGNDWRAAYKAMQIHAARLKAAGFAVGPPSFTGWVHEWDGYFAELHAAGLLDPYASIVIHPYGKDRAEVLNALRVARRIADRYGKQLDADEYGLRRDTPLATALAELPGVIADVRALTDRSAYFIVSETGKQPHDSFAWARRKSGEWREDVRAMLRAANGATSR